MDFNVPGFPDLHYFPVFAQTHVHCIDDAIQLSHPLLPPSSPALSLSQHQGLFQWAGSPSQVAKVLELQLQPSVFPVNIQADFFRIDWFDLLSVQGTLKSFLQHHSLKTSILQPSALFMVQLSHPYMTMGKTIALTRLGAAPKFDIWSHITKQEEKPLSKSLL